MSQKKRGLGRGLSDLGLGELLQGGGAAIAEVPVEARLIEEPVASKDGQLCQLAIEKVVPGRYQPRTQFEPEALEELAEPQAA